MSQKPGFQGCTCILNLSFLLFFFPNILKSITSRALLHRNRSRFQHALLRSHFRTVRLQPSDLQQLALVGPATYLDLKMTRTNPFIIQTLINTILTHKHLLIQDLQKFGREELLLNDCHQCIHVAAV